MNSCDTQAPAAMALLSTPVLRSAMDARQSSPLAKEAVLRLVESGFAEGLSTVRALIWRCDKWLSRNYRSDLVYRKAVVSKMFGSVAGTLLPEFRANRSFADFLSVSEQLHIVEIKSDLDNTSRLTRQLADYRKIAPLVSIVGKRHIIEKIALNETYASVGLHWLDDADVVRAVRVASYDVDDLDSSVMMRSLRRSEFSNVLSRLGKSLPELPNTRVFSASLELSRSIDPVEYYDEFLLQLQQRKPRVGRSAIARLPAPVRPAIWKLDPTALQVTQLQHWLNQEVAYVYA